MVPVAGVELVCYVYDRALAIVRVSLERDSGAGVTEDALEISGLYVLLYGDGGVRVAQLMRGTGNPHVVAVVVIQRGKAPLCQRGFPGIGEDKAFGGSSPGEQSLLQ